MSSGAFAGDVLFGFATVGKKVRLWRTQQPATTTFARSRLPRSLLNAHSAATDCWLVSAIRVGKVQELTLWVSAATGDILAGFEIADPAEIEGHLDALDYEYRLVT